MAESEIEKFNKDSSAVSAEEINNLQNSMLSIRCNMPNAEHFFSPGIYVRSLQIPAGMLIVGKRHKFEHPVMLLKGKAVIVSEHGKEIIEAGYIGISKAGIKRVVLALEDCVFATVHHNPENTEDAEIIEATHIENEQFKLCYHFEIKEFLK